jgi:hypothetical protein
MGQIEVNPGELPRSAGILDAHGAHGGVGQMQATRFAPPARHTQDPGVHFRRHGAHLIPEASVRPLRRFLGDPIGQFR